MDKKSKLSALKKMGSFFNPFAPSAEQIQKPEIKDEAPKDNETEEERRKRKEREHDRKELNDILKMD